MKITLLLTRGLQMAWRIARMARSARLADHWPVGRYEPSGSQSCISLSLPPTRRFVSFCAFLAAACPRTGDNVTAYA